MKYIAKMMLALLASVTMVAQAYAWDFSASGSASATFDMTTTAPEGGDAITEQGFSGSSGGVSLKSSHTDGDNSYTLTYKADVDTDGTQADGNVGLDETLSLSASKKVGKWTASATASQSLREDGTTERAKISGDDGAVITITDGSMTHKLGDAAHLSTAEKTSDTTAGGAVDAEARVDGFKGYSLGMAVGPGALTIAVDMSHGTATSLMGDLTTALGVDGQHTGFGVNFSGNVGVDLAFTYATGSAKAHAGGSETASANTMGLGVNVPMGTFALAVDYEASTFTTPADTTTVQSGFEVSTSLSEIADGTVVINVSSQAKKVGDGEAATTAGTELGWKTPIGPTSLEIAYGTSTTDAQVVTDIEVEMTFSF
jgi:hypothetical protein